MKQSRNHRTAELVGDDLIICGFGDRYCIRDHLMFFASLVSITTIFGSIV